MWIITSLIRYFPPQRCGIWWFEFEFKFDFFFFPLFPLKSVINKTGWKGECRYICDELVSSPPYPTIERKECYKSRPRLLPWMQVSGSWFCRWITDKRKDKPANKQTIKLTKQQDDKKYTNLDKQKLWSTKKILSLYQYRIQFLIRI